MGKQQQKAGLPGEVIEADFDVFEGDSGEGQLAVIQGGPTTNFNTSALSREYYTARTIGIPRNLNRSRKGFLAEANIAGEAFFYIWDNKKDDKAKGGDKTKKKPVEGPSIDCAMAGLRNWGNVAQEMMPLQEERDSWIMTARIIDLETGFTTERQFRQSKNWTVYGNFDAARKEDIRFQIGQSKAIRNCALNFLPSWYIAAAMIAAKDGVRNRILKYIQDHGKDSAISHVLHGLAKHGVTEAAILHKFEFASLSGFDVDEIIVLRSDLAALDSGHESADVLFPAMAEEPRSDSRKKEQRRTLSDVGQAEQATVGNAGQTTAEPPVDTPITFTPGTNGGKPPAGDKSLAEQLAEKQRAAAAEAAKEEPPFDAATDPVVATWTSQINNATTEAGVRKILERLAKSDATEAQKEELGLRGSARMDSIRNG